MKNNNISSIALLEESIKKLSKLYVAIEELRDKIILWDERKEKSREKVKTKLNMLS